MAKVIPSSLVFCAHLNALMPSISYFVCRSPMTTRVVLLLMLLMAYNAANDAIANPTYGVAGLSDGIQCQHAIGIAWYSQPNGTECIGWVQLHQPFSDYLQLMG